MSDCCIENLDPLALSDIAAQLEVHTVSPRHVSLAFVFGTRLEQPATVAAGLLTSGVAPLVVLTGKDETTRHQGILLDLGIPQNQILIEAGPSYNTGENVLHALPVIASRVGLADVESIAVVAKWYHARRAMMTLKRHMPAGILYYAATYEPPLVSRSNWAKSDYGRQRVLKEWRVLPEYLARGFLAPICSQDGVFV